LVQDIEGSNPGTRYHFVGVKQQFDIKDKILEAVNNAYSKLQRSKLFECVMHLTSHYGLLHGEIKKMSRG